MSILFRGVVLVGVILTYIFNNTVHVLVNRALFIINHGDIELMRNYIESFTMQEWLITVKLVTINALVVSTPEGILRLLVIEHFGDLLGTLIYILAVLLASGLSFGLAYFFIKPMFARSASKFNKSMWQKKPKNIVLIVAIALLFILLLCNRINSQTFVIACFLSGLMINIKRERGKYIVH